jgi:hypothetical protein
MHDIQEKKHQEDLVSSTTSCHGSTNTISTFYFPFQIIDQISVRQFARLFRRAIYTVRSRINQIRLEMNMEHVINRNINNVRITNTEIINETRI